jgi:hypothetical protein
MLQACKAAAAALYFRVLALLLVGTAHLLLPLQLLLLHAAGVELIC